MPTRKWKTELLVNSTTFGQQNQSSVVALTDGGFLVAWRDEGPSDSVIRAQRFDATGARVGTEFVVNGAGGDQLNPVLVALSDGNVWALQQDFDSANDHDIAGQVIQPDGTVVRAQDANGSGNDEVRPAGASLGTNGAVAVWMNLNANGGDIHMRGFNADGTERFATATVNTNAGTLADIQYGPSVAGSPDGGKFVVVWGDQGETTGEVRARVFNADGTEAAAEFAVSSLSPLTAPDASTSVAWLDNNRFAVTWFSFSGDGSHAAIKYAIFNANGTSFTGERLANSTTYGSQEDPVIAALPSGGFVIAWMDFSGTGGDNSFSGIRLQAFDGAGDKIGGEILVNTTTNFGQFDVSLTALADGRVVVTWTDASGSGDDPSGNAVRAQIIDPRDGIVDGTSKADTLYGHDSVGDEIRGFDGDDIIYGLAGNDIIQGGSGIDTIYAGKGDDFVYGGLDGDVIFGDAGDDEIYGEQGSDTIYGDTGDDVIYGGDADDFLYGGLGADIISGGAGIDLLDGGAGADTLDGGLGNDVYVIDNAGDVVIETNGGGSADRVTVSVSYTLKAGVQVEQMTTTDAAGKSPLSITGNSFTQKITGNAGDNTLNDGGGNAADTLTGLAGNDTYIIHNADAVIVEAGGQGTDRVLTSVSYVLKNGVSVETLGTTLQNGTSAINLTGNSIGQTIQGNAGDNIIDGKGGADTLYGYGGKDTFVFSSPIGASFDTIMGFNVPDDTIRLDNDIFTKLTSTGVLDSNFYRANSTGTAVDADDYVLYNFTNGMLFYDADGSGPGTKIHFATLVSVTPTTPSAVDFEVV